MLPSAPICVPSPCRLPCAHCPRYTEPSAKVHVPSPSHLGVETMEIGILARL